MISDEVTIIVGPDSVERALKELPFLTAANIHPASDPNIQVFCGGQTQKPYLLRISFNAETRTEFMKRKEIQVTMKLKNFRKLAQKGALSESFRNAFEAAEKQSNQIEAERKERQKLGFENTGVIGRSAISLFDRTIGLALEAGFTSTKQSPVTSVAIEEVPTYNRDATITVTKVDKLAAFFC